MAVPRALGTSSPAISKDSANGRSAERRQQRAEISGVVFKVCILNN
jgi:hypothetical protein